MKKIIYTICLLAAAFSVKANHLNSELVMDVAGNTQFTMALDNQYYGVPDFSYRVLDIIPGVHYLEVNAMNHSGHYPEMIFSGHINIPAASKVIAKIDRFGRFHVLNVLPLLPAPVVFNNTYYPMPSPPPCHIAMSDYDFDMLRHSIESKSFESTRMEIIKQVLRDRFVSARQVSELMNLMWFESSKLDVAKLAYRKTVDKENYFRINDAFTFESSISELDEFIRNQG